MKTYPVTLHVPDLEVSNQLFIIAKERAIKAESGETNKIDIEQLKKHALLLEEIEKGDVKNSSEMKSDTILDAVKILTKQK